MAKLQVQDINQKINLILALEALTIEMELTRNDTERRNLGKATDSNQRRVVIDTRDDELRKRQEQLKSGTVGQGMNSYASEVERQSRAGQLDKHWLDILNQVKEGEAQIAQIQSEWYVRAIALALKKAEIDAKTASNFKKIDSDSLTADEKALSLLAANSGVSSEILLKKQQELEISRLDIADQLRAGLKSDYDENRG